MGRELGRRMVRKDFFGRTVFVFRCSVFYTAPDYFYMAVILGYGYL